MRRMIALLGALMMLCGSAFGETLQLMIPGKIRPFQQQTIEVQAPCAGRLTLSVRDEYGIQRPIAEEMQVLPGKTELTYAGLSYCDMPLYQGRCTITATLQCEDGTVLESVGSASIGSSQTRLEYALPRSETYYTEQTESWRVDCGVTGEGVYRLEIFQDEALTNRIAAVGKHINNRGMFSIPWKGETDRGALQPGAYWCRVSMKGEEAQGFVMPLYVEQGAPPKEKIYRTGSLLPESDDPDELLEKFCEPLVVVDIEATEHQKIYEEPDRSGRVLGTVHGQSQGLEVIETGDAFTHVGAWRHEDGEYIRGYIPTELLKVVRPFEHYGVVVDKPKQELRVYEYGMLIGKMRISTGLMAQNKLFRETRAGAFITTDRMIAFKSGKYTYDYPIRIDGGNLIHQMGYRAKSGFADHAAQLGGKASEGCVRMDYRTDGEYNLNAYWMWTHLEWGTKVLVLDDPADRVARMDTLR